MSEDTEAEIIRVVEQAMMEADDRSSAGYDFELLARAAIEAMRDYHQLRRASKVMGDAAEGGRPMTVRVNLNNHARVRLTEAGRKVWHDEWAPYSLDGTGMDHKVAADGVLREQLWQIIHTFGPRIGRGFAPVFASVEIEIEDAAEIAGDGRAEEG